MKDYFRLQTKLIYRRLVAFGLPTYLILALLPLVFVALSDYLFSVTEYASFIYCFSALIFVSKLSETNRNDFLKSIYNRQNYLIIRASENLLLAAPFLIFLLYKASYLVCTSLIVLVIAVASINFNTKLNFTFPTPFSKKPFEFSVGFRKSFFMFPLAYVLTTISIYVGNFNLGIFSLVLICFTCMSYYSIPENEYFVWNHNLSAKQFLFNKTKSGLINFTLLSLPTIAALCIFFYSDALILLAIFILSLVYLSTIILAKYSDFPHEMNVSHGILIGISFMLPPILIMTIPRFYNEAESKLKRILE